MGSTIYFKETTMERVLPCQPHVLLFPLPTQGHINPFLDLGQRLSSSGILSTLLLIPSNFRSLSTIAHFRSSSSSEKEKKEQLVRFAALDLPPEIDGKLSSGTLSPEIFHILDTQLMGPLRAFILSFSRVFTNAHRDPVIAITTLGEEQHHDDDDDDDIVHFPPISCLVSDTFMPWTLDLARDLGIPRVEMWTASATAYAFASSIPQLISNGLLPFKQGTQDLELAILPAAGISTPRLGHLAVIFLSLDHPSHPIFQTVIRAFSCGAESDRVLVNSVNELEVGAVAALTAKNVRIAPIGPLLGAQNSTTLLDEAQLRCLRWLDMQEAKSVVYVAFGSAGFLSEEEIREMAMALEVVGKPFLWAIRDGSATESLPENFRAGYLPEEKGLIVSWAPQRHVLEHPSIGVFVSHCGWNSILESVCCGVPIVGCPRVSEQNTNMWLVQEWGFGVSGVDTMMGGKGSLRSATLIQALQHVMGTPGMDTDNELCRVNLKKVAEVAAAAHTAVSPTGTSTQAFQAFVKDLLEKC